MKEEYNWWEDPKNAEEVKRISWWDKPENKSFAQLPIAIVQDGESWTACTIDQEKHLGDSLHAVASGKTKEEAISKLFLMLRISHEFTEERWRKYQRWVPFRKGDWKHTGGTWFVVFGIHVYFRHGKRMQGVWFVPFTELNISVSNEWRGYNRWKLKQKKEA